MPTLSVAVASSTKPAADAGAEVTHEGGNAVDAAIAAAWAGAIAEPGICAPGCGGFVTIWSPDDDPVTIDGYIEMPGRGLPPERFGKGTREVHLDYGGEPCMSATGQSAHPAALRRWP